MIAHYVRETGVAADDEYEEFASFEIDVLAPERTLVEKLALLHRLSLKGDGEELARSGRHIYDVYKLLTAEWVMARLRSDPSTVARLAADSDEQSKKWKMAVEPRPEAGYGRSPVFDLTRAPTEHLRRGLEAAQPLIYGPVPTFEDCIEVVRSAADVL